MSVRFGTTVRGEPDVGMLRNVVLKILNRAFAANEQQGVLVIQLANLIRRHELAARDLPVGGITAVPASGTTVSIGINSLFTE